MIKTKLNFGVLFTLNFVSYIACCWMYRRCDYEELLKQRWKCCNTFCFAEVLCKQRFQPVGTLSLSENEDGSVSIPKVLQPYIK